MYCKMVVVTVEKYANAEVHTIAVKNKKLFWVKMSDVVKGLGVKNIINGGDKRKLSENVFFVHIINGCYYC